MFDLKSSIIEYFSGSLKLPKQQQQQHRQQQQQSSTSFCTANNKSNKSEGIINCSSMPLEKKMYGEVANSIEDGDVTRPGAYAMRTTSSSSTTTSKSEDEGISIATAVSDDDYHHNSSEKFEDEEFNEAEWIPAAIEHHVSIDVMKKKIKSKYCVRIMVLVSLTCILLGIGYKLVFPKVMHHYGLDGNGSKDSSSEWKMHPADVKTIQSRMETVLGHPIEHGGAEHQALKWLINIDTFAQNNLNARNLEQRFLLAYFYYETSELSNSPWLSCNPPNKTIHVKWDFCNFKEYFKWHDSDEDPYRDTRSTRWLSPGRRECQWAGITCDGDDGISGSVTKISLEGQHLSGAFPKALMKLSKLQTLYLSVNNFKGPLPKDIIGEMSALEDIGLSDNYFTGTIPDQWFEDAKTKNSTIQSLNLGGNQLQGTIPLEQIAQSMSNMKYLRFSNSQMSGTIPSELFLHLKNLRSISLEKNTIKGTIPTEIGLATDLSTIRLGGTELTGTLPSEIGNLQSLDTLDLGVSTDGHENGLLHGPIPIEIVTNCKLWRLDLSNNQFTGTIPTEIGLMTDLSKLDLHNNQFTGTIPTQLGNIKGIGAVYVQNNDGLVGAVPSELCGLRKPSNGKMGGFITMIADCGGGGGGGGNDNDSVSTTSSNIHCPAECCTQCCDPKTDVCFEI